MGDVAFRSVTDLRADSLRPRTIIQASLNRIREFEDDIGAFITVTDGRAEDTLSRLAQPETDQNADPLHGIPVAIKDDLAHIAGIEHTYGSILFSGNRCGTTSEIVHRLERAGAVVLGKTNLPPLAFGVKTDNELVGQTKTPFDTTYNAGGSSGGSAAAVAAGFTPIAIGTDFGGSVRIPSSYCGILGLKPTFGRIPLATRPDAFLGSIHFDNYGIHTTSVKDAAVLLDVLSGADPTDPFSIPAPGKPFANAIDGAGPQLELAFSPDLGYYSVADPIRRTVADAVSAYRNHGLTVEPLDIDLDLAEILRSGRLPKMQVRMARLEEILERKHDLNLREEDPNDISPKFFDLANEGRNLSAMDLKRADVACTKLYDQVCDLLSEFDILLTPTVAVPPIDSESDVTDLEGQYGAVYDWFLTWPFNVTGHPAATIPIGTDDAGLPIGLQVIAGKFREADLLKCCSLFEEIRPWDDLYPPPAVR